MMKNVEKPKDFADEIYNLFSESYGESPWTINTIIMDLKQDNRLFIAAFEHQQLIGFLSAIQIQPESEITNLAILPAFRRLKIAQKLIQMLQEQTEIIYLEVRENNKKALSLYQKMAFYQIGRRQAYYQNPKEDAILMEWRKNVLISD